MEEEEEEEEEKKEKEQEEKEEGKTWEHGPQQSSFLSNASIPRCYF